MSRVSATLQSLVKIVSAVAPPRGGEIYGSCAFFIIKMFVFIFLDTHTDYTREPILTHNSSCNRITPLVHIRVQVL